MSKREAGALVFVLVREFLHHQPRANDIEGRGEEGSHGTRLRGARDEHITLQKAKGPQAYPSACEGIPEGLEAVDAAAASVRTVDRLGQHRPVQRVRAALAVLSSRGHPGMHPKSGRISSRVSLVSAEK